MRRGSFGSPSYWAWQATGWTAFVVLIVAAGVADDPGLNRQIWALDWSFFALSGLLASSALHWLEARKGFGWRLLPYFFACLAAMLVLRHLLVVFGEPAPYDRTEWFGVATIVEAAAALGLAGGIFLAAEWSSQLQQSRAEQVSIAAALQAAQLRALRAQVQPHFLFNSLNTVRALIANEPVRARDAITMLADILRASLAADRQPTITWQEELAIARQYLRLQEMRFETRLRYELNAAPEILQSPVPPFLLQELLENAIKHGIAQREEGGSISVEVFAADGAVRAQIVNSGQLSSGGRDANGTGLKALNDRLTLLFGSRANLKIRQLDAETVVAEVSLPLL